MPRVLEEGGGLVVCALFAFARVRCGARVHACVACCVCGTSGGCSLARGAYREDVPNAVCDIMYLEEVQIAVMRDVTLDVTHLRTDRKAAGAYRAI